MTFFVQYTHLYLLLNLWRLAIWKSWAGISRLAGRQASKGVNEKGGYYGARGGLAALSLLILVTAMLRPKQVSFNANTIAW
jgi:hypothetical protein